MPIYEYACSDCGKAFEKIQRADIDQAPCPACGKTAERIVSRPAAIATGNDDAPAPGCGSGGFT